MPSASDMTSPAEYRAAGSGVGIVVDTFVGATVGAVMAGEGVAVGIDVVCTS